MSLYRSLISIRYADNPDIIGLPVLSGSRASFRIGAFYVNRTAVTSAETCAQKRMGRRSGHHSAAVLLAAGSIQLLRVKLEIRLGPGRRQPGRDASKGRAQPSGGLRLTRTPTDRLSGSLATRRPIYWSSLRAQVAPRPRTLFSRGPPTSCAFIFSINPDFEDANSRPTGHWVWPICTSSQCSAVSWTPILDRPNPVHAFPGVQAAQRRTTFSRSRRCHANPFAWFALLRRRMTALRRGDPFSVYVHRADRSSRSRHWLQ